MSSDNVRSRLAAAIRRFGANRVRTGQIVDAAGLGGESGPGQAGAAADAPASRELPAALGRFRPRRKLGSGAMGTVLAAVDPDLHREVAVKVVHYPDGDDREAAIRFLNEARVTGQLQHPNIVPVHDFGVSDDGDLFYVMRRIDGRSLREILDNLESGDRATVETWSRYRLLSAVVQICDAVAFAHERGVLHRDLKPDNIMLGEFGEIVVMDWGLARLDTGAGEPALPARGLSGLQDAGSLTGQMLGTPGYASPEQLAGERDRVDERSDVWALGAILYEIVTGRPAFDGTAAQVIAATLGGPPEEPRQRAPARGIDAELARIVTRAMAPRPADRHSSAAELGRALRDHLAGERRREESERQLDEGRALWDRYRALGEEEARLSATEERLLEEIPRWAPLAEKTELLATTERRDEVMINRATVFSQVVARGERAVARDPDNAAAARFLAEAYLHQLRDAERRRDRRDIAFYEDRVRAYDDGRFAAQLDGTGALTLATDPPGAQVWLQQYQRRGLIWSLQGRRLLGHTPVRAHALPMGSYLLTLRISGKRDTLYPVHITRNHHWTSGAEPLPLLTDADIGDDFVYIPAGPCLIGGDGYARGQFARAARWVDGFLLTRLPVTSGAYAAFLTALARRDPDLAWARSPRERGDPSVSGHHLWPRPNLGEPFRVPQRDGDGDAWSPDWPACGLSWHDAQAYAAWMRERVPGARLMTELEYEKAARGVDGREFPWGDRFDPAVCVMRDSHRDRMKPRPVGAADGDASPYGVRDLAGSIREWCGDPSFDGDPETRPIRGGAWSTTTRACQAANRFGQLPDKVNNFLGMRIARSLPG